MKVLITGGAGYIGSTIAHALSARGIGVVVLDSLERGNRDNVRGLQFYEGRISNTSLFGALAASEGDIDVTIHCASLISVPESQREPLWYMQNNVGEFIELLANLRSINCSRMIFSSSASIYGALEGEVLESDRVEPKSVYAQTKWLIEQILSSVSALTDLRAISLRYFNPIGTEAAARCGPGNINDGTLLNELTKAVLRESEFSLTGDDWNTRDGSGLRDYVDVGDLAEAHVLACTRFDKVTPPSALGSDRSTAINLGTARGVTVKEMIHAAETALGKPISVKVLPRRSGDVAGSFANAGRAAELLGWRPTVPLEHSIRTHANWWRTKLSNP